MAVPHLRLFNLGPKEMSVRDCPLCPREQSVLSQAICLHWGGGVGEGATGGPSWCLSLACVPSLLPQPEILGVVKWVHVGPLNLPRRC